MSIYRDNIDCLQSIFSKANLSCVTCPITNRTPYSKHTKRGRTHKETLKNRESNWQRVKTENLVSKKQAGLHNYDNAVNIYSRSGFAPSKKALILSPSCLPENGANGE